MDHGRVGSENMSGLPDVLVVPRALIGMVHLLPLPGSPRWGGSMEEVVERAVEDAGALAAGGMNALLVENHGDIPFYRERVDAATVAAMTRVIAELRRAVRLPVGVNVLKNDGRSALAVAAATGACFIRVNVHTGAAVADKGSSSPRPLPPSATAVCSPPTSRSSPTSRPSMVSPWRPLRSSKREARDCVSRGLADALVVSGKATGEATPLADVKRIRSAVREVPLLVGSGVTAESVAELLSVADGAIVGTSLKREGRLDNPVDPERVKRLVEAARAG